MYFIKSSSQLSFDGLQKIRRFLVQVRDVVVHVFADQLLLFLDPGFGTGLNESQVDPLFLPEKDRTNAS